MASVPRAVQLAAGVLLVASGAFAEGAGAVVRLGGAEAEKRLVAGGLSFQHCVVWQAPLRTYPWNAALPMDHPAEPVAEPIGGAIECVPDPLFDDGRGNRFRLVRRFGQLSLVPAQELRVAAPTRDELLERAGAALARDPARTALQIAILASVKYPRDAELLTVQQLAAELAGDAETASAAREVLTGLRAESIRYSPPIAAPEAAPSSIEPGDALYVREASSAVWTSADGAGLAIAQLPINAEVRVEAVAPGWVKLSAPAAGTSDEHWELSLRFARRIRSARAPVAAGVAGYVRAEQLSSTRLTPAALLAVASDHEKAGRFPEALRSLTRAAMLEPPAPALIQRALDAAVRARDWLAVAQWRTSKRSQLADPDGFAHVRMEVVAGCRGDRTRAALVDGVPLVYAEPAPCDLERCPWTEEMSQQVPADACLAEVRPRCGYCEKKARAARSHAGSRDFEKWVASVVADAAVKRVHSAFAGGTWVRASVRVLSSPMNAKTRLFAYEAAPFEGCEQPRRALRQLKVSKAGVPLPAPGEQRFVWIRPSRSDRGRVGLVAAQSPALARKEAAKRATEGCELPEDQRAAVEEELLCDCAWPADWTPEQALGEDR